MSTPTYERGNLLFRILWEHHSDCTVDVRITNPVAPSIIHRKPEAVLLSHEEKKKKYLQACLDQRRHFSPCEVSCDEVLANEAKVVLQSLAGRKPGQEIRKVLFRNVKLHEVKDEHCNCARHTTMHSRITYPRRPNEPTSPVERRSRHPTVLPLDG